MKRIFVKPNPDSKHGNRQGREDGGPLLVRLEHGGRIDPEGQEVEKTPFISRLLKSGDLIHVESESQIKSAMKEKTARKKKEHEERLRLAKGDKEKSSSSESDGGQE